MRLTDALDPQMPVRACGRSGFMGRRRRGLSCRIARATLLAGLVAACCALALALARDASATTEPPLLQRWIAAHPANYPRASRPPRLIRFVVVHVAEGSYGGTVSWFRNPRARVSTHYVISRRGEVTRMLPLNRAGWHAGNAYVNRHSIGLEHEGFTFVPWTFTEAEYRASARVVASVMRSRLLPIDRRRIIGHHEVPDPNRRGHFGGFAHHRDPGPYWDWARYMRYVRAYAAGRTPPPPAFDVTSDSFAFLSTVKGVLPWEATVSGSAPQRVEFRIDGRLRDVRTEPPYRFGGAEGVWDTTRETNGRHRLAVRAVAADGRRVESSVVVTVNNPPPPPVIENVGFAEGEAVWGPRVWQPTLSGRITRVEFLVDGVVRDTRTSAPFVFGGAGGAWDASAEPPGEHVLTVRAVGPRATATASARVVVTPPQP